MFLFVSHIKPPIPFDAKLANKTCFIRFEANQYLLHICLCSLLTEYRSAPYERVLEEALVMYRGHENELMQDGDFADSYRLDFVSKF
jgi:hypothetical protein